MSTPEATKKRNAVSPDDGVEKKELLTAFDLTNGDNSLAEAIIKLAATEEDPPLVFGWNTPALESFWANAVFYQGAPTPAIPIPINGGVNLLPVADVDRLKSELLNYVCTQQAVGNRPSVLGNTVGLGCTQAQAINMGAFLRGLELSPWFQAVLAHGVALPTPLAAVYTPRPKNTRGLLDQLTIGGVLWA